MDGFVRYAEAYRAELQHFLSLAVGEAADVSTARDGLAAVTIAVAAGDIICTRSKSRAC